MTDVIDPVVSQLIMWGPILLMLISAASAVFLGLCIYNDARTRCDGNAVMWGVLSGFFWIAALVYLCMRSSAKSVACPRCRQVYPVDCPACPACGLPSPGARLIGTPEQRERWKKRRKRYLILYIAMVLAVVLIIAAVVCAALGTAGAGRF